MQKELVMPVIAADTEFCTLEEWRKQAGDRIEVGEVYIDAATEKALIEVEADFSGILVVILVPAGTEGVAVGTPIAIIEVEGEDENLKLEPEDRGQKAVGATEPTAGIGHDQVTSTLTRDAGSQAATSERIAISPVARSAAKNYGLDLSSIKGSGPNGRIVIEDIEALASQQQSHSIGSSDVAEDIKTPDGTSALKAPTLIPISQTRRLIAERLSDAKRSIPHYYLTMDCELDALLAMRKRMNDELHGSTKISINDLLVKAVALSLREVPAVNVSWGEENIQQYQTIDIAIAVATDRGLVTPVVRNADRKAVFDISSEIMDFANRAQSGRLKPKEYKGGGITVSNLGMYGIKQFFAIINPPQSSILSVGGAEQRVVVKAGEMVIATMLNCSLSADHRSVDGAVGAKFLSSLKQTIEQPDELLM